MRCCWHEGRCGSRPSPRPTNGADRLGADDARRNVSRSTYPDARCVRDNRFSRATLAARGCGSDAIVMARPVRPGTGTTHRMSEASQPGKQNGTLFAAPTRASSPKSTASTGRTEDCSRPTPVYQASLALREPSTEAFRTIGTTAAVGRKPPVRCLDGLYPLPGRRRGLSASTGILAGLV